MITKKIATRVGEPGNRPAINIDPERVSFWTQGPKNAACLVDTLAHELTHLIPLEPNSLEQRYQDRIKVDRVDMVSYSFGHAAGCFRLGKAPNCLEMLECPGT